MIGIIEKVLVDCLLEAGGEELKADAFLKAGIPRDRVYRLDRHYPDEETGRLLAAALHVTGLEEGKLFEIFSDNFLDVIGTVFPRFLEMASNSEELVRMQAKIHALIAAGIRTRRGSTQTTDKFQLESLNEHHLIVRYRSELQLCGLYTKLVEAAARRYGDEVLVEEMSCRHKGAEACRMSVKWLSIDGNLTLHSPQFPLDVAKTG